MSAIATGCRGSEYEPPGGFQYASFKDVPGVTDDEIRAVEALRDKYGSFEYSMQQGVEAFRGEDGELRGFAVRVCEWLSELFQIPFEVNCHDWPETLEGLESGAIDFTGDMTPNEERRKTYFMTDPISERPIKTIRLAGSTPLSEIADSRPARLMFMGSAVTAGVVTASYVYGPYEIIYIDTVDIAYDMLKSGEADALFVESIIEYYFESRGDVVISNYLPLIYNSVAMAARNPELEPIISVVQKILQNGGDRHVSGLYELGYYDYIKNSMLLRLGGEEREYIAGNPVVPFAAEFDNYPLSFYNEREKQWQGIAFDVLGEVEKLTGLTFEVVNDTNTEWSELLRMLTDGEVPLVSELIRTREREGNYLWPDNLLVADRYALISKTDLPNIRVNEILHMRVGVNRGTAYEEVFRRWFPNSVNMVGYESLDAAFGALVRGEIDMVMSSQRQILQMTNFHEQVGYKINFVFEYFAESTFGFNKNSEILCSIVDKALGRIDIQSISDEWMHRTYDYRAKLAQAQLPWLIGVIALLVVLFALFALFQKNRHKGKQLETLMLDHTNELSKQHTLMSLLNDVSALLLEPDSADYSHSMKLGMWMVSECVQVDNVYVWQSVQKDDETLCYKQICKWTRDGMSYDDDILEQSYQEAMPNLRSMFLQGKSVNGPLDSLPEEERSFFAAYNIQSLLAVPLFLKGEFWGFVSFDDCNKRRVFSGAEESVLRSWGLLAVGAIKRGETSRGMHNTLNKLEAVINNYKGI
ncbi:MAG: transporter substrate-binding domain-containing protein, partial [Oscillospiraceae bacterium]|nr:transporter substrate-binding domain-containing protein [Oscillospiraceae bacterium]